MKKKLLVLVMLLFSANFVFAQTTLTIDNVSASANTEVSVGVNVTNFLNVGSVTLKILYDPGVLTYTGIQNSNLAGATIGTSSGEVRIAWYSTTAINIQDGKLFDLVFDYSTGESNITVGSPFEVTDPSFSKIQTTITNGSVSLLTSLDAPTLESPANNTTDVIPPVVLQWSDVDGAESYAVQVSVASNFSTTVVNESGLTVSEYTIPSGILSNGVKYYWRTSAASGELVSGNSSTFGFTTQPDLEAPTLSAPEDNATGVDLMPLFTWSNVDGATSFNLQVSTTEDFASPVIDESGITIEEFGVTATALDELTTYYWRVNATDGNRVSDWSSVFSFTTLTTVLPLPVLVSPADAAEGVELSGTSLTWNAVEGASSYSVELSTAQDFSSTIISEENVSGTSLSIEDGILDYQTTYYWHVKAVAEGKASDWTEPWSFMTVLPDLEVPVLSSPADDAVDVELSPLFTWSNVDGATSFRIQVTAASDFSSPLIDESGLTMEEYQMTTSLEEMTEYYWRVNATDGNRVSAWSPVFSFTTLTTVLPLPVLATPANEAEGIPLGGTSLTWNAAEGATSYSLELSTAQDFSSTVVSQDNIAETSLSVSDGILQYETTYYWRVKASAEGKASDWTEPWSFTTELAPLGIPTLTSPSDGAENIIIKAAFEWSGVDNATSYGLQVATENTFASPAVDESGLTETSFEVAEDLEGMTNYFWRVRSEDATRTGDWSDVWSFTTEDPSSVQGYKNGIPEEFSLMQNYPNPFNPSTRIRYTLPEASHVKVVIVDLLGREVSELFHGFQSAGYFELNWDASKMSSGNYIYKIDVKTESGKLYSDIKKMLFLK